MIRATAEEFRYLTKFTNGTGSGFADALREEGGTGISFRPAELLEAALATSISVSVRMYAEHHGIPLEDIRAQVVLDTDSPSETSFQYTVEFIGDRLSEEQRAKLQEVARNCQVRRILSRPIQFRPTASLPQNNNGNSTAAAASRG